MLGFVVVMTASMLSGLRWTITQVLLQGTPGSSGHGASGGPVEVLLQLTPGESKSSASMFDTARGRGSTMHIDSGTDPAVEQTLQWNRPCTLQCWCEVHEDFLVIHLSKLTVTAVRVFLLPSECLNHTHAGCLKAVCSWIQQAKVTRSCNLSSQINSKHSMVTSICVTGHV